MPRLVEVVRRGPVELAAILVRVHHRVQQPVLFVDVAPGRFRPRGEHVPVRADGVGQILAAREAGAGVEQINRAEIQPFERVEFGAEPLEIDPGDDVMPRGQRHVRRLVPDDLRQDVGIAQAVERGNTVRTVEHHEAWVSPWACRRVVVALRLAERRDDGGVLQQPLGL